MPKTALSKREYNPICLMEKEWNGYYNWPLLSISRCSEKSMLANTVQN